MAHSLGSSRQGTSRAASEVPPAASPAPGSPLDASDTSDRCFAVAGQGRPLPDCGLRARVVSPNMLSWTRARCGTIRRRRLPLPPTSPVCKPPSRSCDPLPPRQILAVVSGPPARRAAGRATYQVARLMGLGFRAATTWIWMRTSGRTSGRTMPPWASTSYKPVHRFERAGTGGPPIKGPQPLRKWRRLA